jgi:hypothetical protein
MTDRIDGIEERLRAVEAAVIELGLLSKYAKWGVLILAAGFGFDIQGMI